MADQSSDPVGEPKSGGSAVKKELGMSLEIVWRNPIPVIRTKRTLHRVEGNRFVVIYEVTDPNGRQEFRLECDRIAS